MKRYIGLVAFVTFFYGVVGFAQDAVADPFLSQVLAFLAPMLEAGAGKYGWLVQILTVVGVMRLMFKPIMTVVQTIINLTPSVSDDAFLAKVMDNWFYKAAVYIVDWTASIKLPKRD